jgi:hypothetical protein
LLYAALEELIPVDAAVNVVTTGEASAAVRPLWAEGLEGEWPAVSALPAAIPPPRTSTPLATAAVSAVFLVVFAFSTVIILDVIQQRHCKI